MISRSKWLTALSLLIIASFILAACKTETIVETVEVEVEKEVEVPVEVEVLITPTPEPIPQGGSMVESSFADATILNPILSNDQPSSEIHNRIYEGMVGQDPFTGAVIPNFAESWTVSEDGLVFTFKFREDVVWSDGTPLTAKDFKFTYDAVASELVDTPRKSNIELVESIELIDDYTVDVTFSEVDCTALPNLGLGILPAHKFAEDFSDIMDSPENKAPSVASGPFIFQEWIPDDHATLVRNESYFKGAPNMDGYIYRIFADQSAELAALLAGEIDLLTGLSPQYVSTIEGAIAAGQPLTMKKFFVDGYSWIAMNQANPDNPQNGWVDENENESFDEGEPRQEQDPHPILSDVLVRRAISHAVDVTNIVNKVAFGQGAAIASNILPAVGWAYDDTVVPYAYDLEAAKALLDEAGWLEGADGIRVKDGKRLELTLQTNAGNETRENIMVLVQETLNSIGFDIKAEAVEFSTLVGEMVGQSFDLVLLGWINKGPDPDDVGLWEYRFDTPGSGFNFTSYYNERMEELGQAAKTLPGCDPAERGPMYKEISKMLHDDAPYVFLYNGLGNTIWNNRMNEVDPGPWVTRHNMEAWYISE
jgi:peptide/nickel transport system substrate-binding protein